MPEIVEVESIKRVLHDYYAGNILKNVETFHHSHANGIPRGIIPIFDSIIGSKIISFDRIGKYIIIEFDNKYKLATHLMMSGKFVIGGDHLKHLYVKLLIKNKEPLLFYDPRRFSIMKIYQDIKHLNIGIDALNGVITCENLLLMFYQNKSQIKHFLLTSQNKIAGIGNIYACEILWYARVNPFKICTNITANEAERIVNAIDFILKRALENNGSTLNDKGYSLPDGTYGKAQEFHAVYAKYGKPCPNCNITISKETQKGRSTFYCFNCQK